jgi:hypothetical protein
MILSIYQRRNYNGKQAGTDVVWEGRFIREEPIVPKEALEHWGEEIFQEEIPCYVVYGIYRKCSSYYESRGTGEYSKGKM